VVSPAGHIYVDALIEGRKGQKTLRMFVDTGSTFTLIPQALAGEIGVIKVDGKQKVELADRTRQRYPVGVGNIEILGRKTIGERFLIAEVSAPVAGVLTLEALGLAVDPTTREVRPSRGWQARAPLQARPIP